MFDDLAAFCAVVETHNFAKAAKHLKISTSIITRRVNRLEQELGVKLLQRTTRHVAITEAGSVFYQHATQILQDLTNSKNLVKDLTARVSGLLKIGLPVSISHYYVTHALANFMEKYPDLQMQIVNGNHLLDLLQNGFDLVLHCGNLPDSSFHYKKLGNWTKITCASPAYLAKHGIPKNLMALSKHNCLDHYDNRTKTWLFHDKGKPVTQTICGNININSSIDLKNLALAGLGIVYLPSFTVAKEIAAGQLIPLLSKFSPPALGMYAVYASNQFLSEKVKVFLQFLQELQLC